MIGVKKSAAVSAAAVSSHKSGLSIYRGGQFAMPPVPTVALVVVLGLVAELGLADVLEAPGVLPVTVPLGVVVVPPVVAVAPVVDGLVVAPVPVAVVAAPVPEAVVPAPVPVAVVPAPRFGVTGHGFETPLVPVAPVLEVALGTLVVPA